MSQRINSTSQMQWIYYVCLLFWFYSRSLTCNLVPTPARMWRVDVKHVLNKYKCACVKVCVCALATTSNSLKCVVNVYVRECLYVCVNVLLWWKCEGLLWPFAFWFVFTLQLFDILIAYFCCGVDSYDWFM